MKEVYRVEALSFYYGDVCALKDVELLVREGECVVILGANGVGKSTLLKILDGLLKPAAGRVMFYGKPIEEVSETTAFREEVALLFSEPDCQLFCPTVFDEVCFAPLQLGLGADGAMRRAEEVLRLLGLYHLKERAPHTLSSGEKKKVAIASILSLNPQVLLLDEPTGGLDPRSQVWLLELLEELKGCGKTIVMATHDLSLAGDLAHRVVVMDESHRIVAEGEAISILRDKGLLLEANLIHSHPHRHGDIVHTHGHGPFSMHDEHE